MAGLPRTKVRDGDGKRMILVSREFMDELRSRPPRARASLRSFSEELLRRVVCGDEAKLAILVKGLEAAPVILDMEKDILDQHKAVGYAYTELHDDAVVDDEEAWV